VNFSLPQVGIAYVHMNAVERGPLPVLAAALPVSPGTRPPPDLMPQCAERRAQVVSRTACPALCRMPGAGVKASPPDFYILYYA